ncbi:MAG: sulfur oxidation c-type cytochrome SoxX [bacterium]|jgi:sulfur-oxidizing protein SoxX|nr:sulfur oxidation c-type cytochrome SoxX [Betaproteobacteria bacterium]
MDAGDTRIGRVAGVCRGTVAATVTATAIAPLLAIVLAVAGASAAGAPTVATAAPDAIERPLVEGATDPLRGRAIALGRDGNCLLCHGLADAGRPTGNLAPPLDGVAGRLSAGQIRLRVVNPALANPHTIMPAYFVADGLRQVAAPWRGKPILDAQQIEDLVAWLQTLR